MEQDFPRDWMWSEAFVMLALVECLYREIFRPGCSLSRLKTAGAALILVALPGVNSDQVEVMISGSQLVISGTRVLPSELHTARSFTTWSCRRADSMGASDFLPASTVASGGRWPMAAL